MDRRACDAPMLRNPEPALPSGRAADEADCRTGVSTGRPHGGRHKRAGSPLTGGGNDPWGDLLKLVWSEYSYCTMYGVNIVDGNVLSCENIQRSLTFGPMPAGEASEPAFDEFWEALRILCGRIRNGRLAELRFNRGRPISAKTSEGGRRFKRLLRAES